LAMSPDTSEGPEIMSVPGPSGSDGVPVVD
jgi:hypothetical protein